MPAVPNREAVVATLDLHGAQPPVMVFVEDQGGAGLDAVLRATDHAWNELLDAPEVGARIGGMDEAAQEGFLQALAPMQPLMLVWEEPGTFSDERIDAALGRIETMLLLPMPAEARTAALTDPFGVGMGVLGGSTRTPGTTGVRLEGGRFVSDDGRASFFAVRGRGDEPVGKLVAAVEDAARQAEAAVPGVRVSATGPGAMAAGGERALKDDLMSSLGWSALVQILLLHVVYRHLYAPLWMILPSLLAGLAAVGFWSWGGWPLHGMALGFASSILGLAVDFPLHAVTAAQGHRARGLSPTESWDAVSAHGSAPALCALTSAVGFSSLLFSSSPLLAQIGGLGALSIAFAWLLGAMALPRLLACWSWDPGTGWPDGEQREAQGPSRRASWVAAITLAAMAPFAWGLRLDGDVRSLQIEDVDASEPTQRFEGAFGKAALPALVAHEHADLSPALDAAARTTAALRALPADQRPSSVTALSDMIPPPEVLSARCAALRSADLEALRERMVSAAERKGLTPAVWVPFFDSLVASREGLCATSPVLPDTTRSMGLDELIRRYVRTSPGKASVIVLVGTAADASSLPKPWTDAVTAASPDAFWIHFGSLADASGRSLARELMLLAACSALLIFAVASRALGGARHAALALSTPILSLVGAAGVLGILGDPLLAVGLGALPLVIGLGDDDGIYVVSAMKAGPKAHPRLRRAVTMTTVTTIIGLVPLLFARSPALVAIGKVALAGLSFDVLVALWVLPLLATIGRR